MACDAELEQIVYTVLTLQDDYPCLSPPPRDQHMVSPSFLGIFHDLHSNMETKGCLQERQKHQNRSMKIQLQEWSEKTPLEGISIEIQKNNAYAKGTKRSLSEDEAHETKRSKIQSEKLQPPVSTRYRKRTNYSKEQTIFLQNQFDINPYPDFVRRCSIAKITGIPEPRIQVWFQNRRARHLLKATNSQERKAPCAETFTGFIYKESHYPDIWC
ncbi:hypothetical protein GDO86_007022 [Hymenochirus boettgeri]|uniref:Homeobox protein siamois n=1 Tax=Hymenochirus boettgeri TaxID=247094 RepID=A0A8T2J8B3_9PIPI|nr:hypothetical protein GDO86_007022 [Hymenochirus boettgeri]